MLLAAAVLPVAALAGEENPQGSQPDAAVGTSAEIAEETQPESEAVPDEEPVKEASAGSGEGPVYSYTGELPGDSAGLLGGYLNGVLGDELFSVGDGPITDGGAAAGNRLDGVNRVLYDRLKSSVQLIAAGQSDSTKIIMTIPDLDTDVKYTAADLGLSGDAAEYSESGGLVPTQEAIDALYARLTFNMSLVIDAVLADCPYDMYWYGNYCEWTLPGYTYEITDPASAVLGFTDAFIVLSVRVNDAYRNGSDYAISAGAAASTLTAVDTAKAVVSAAAGKSDYEKLNYYRSWICGAVDYDVEASTAGTAGELQPWNVIYVFDGDNRTDVVCEGYAKAFQYLCDLTEWDGDVYCLCVSGCINGGTHSWNIVHMPDGKNYLADVTNCDTGKVGYPDKLFLTGAAGSVSAGYTSCGQQYVYDSVTADGRVSMWDLYSGEMLTLADSAYIPSEEECSGSFSVDNGWEYAGGKYYYFENGIMVTQRWVVSGGVWYYLKKDGTMAENEWISYNDAVYYMKAGGAMAVGWLEIGTEWYYFRSGGAMQTGWLYSGRVWYYLKENGAMAADEVLSVSGTRYAFRSDGVMVTGWGKLPDGWYYCAASGAVRTGWLKQGTVWYYLQEDGLMAADEVLAVDGVRYAFKSSGAMVTGWGKLSDGWHYSFASGAMFAASFESSADGWKRIGTEWYYFGTDGVMFADCTAEIGGVIYLFDADGKYAAA